MKPNHALPSFSRRTFLKGTATALASLLLSPRRISIAAPPDRLAAGGPIIADHSVVDRYTDIPQTYIDLVKQMWADIPGESHSSGNRKGCSLLQNLDSRFQVSVTEGGAPEANTDQHLRISRATYGDVGHASGWVYGYGEEDWYTSTTAIQRTKDHLTYCNTHNLPIAAMGFGWCWDTTWQNGPGGTTDPVYQVQWAGSSVGGPDGNLRWGLDAGDYALTGNHVCMDTYLDATQQYMAHCTANAYPTKVFFTTGPVDGGGNTGES
ncbi:MAG TPA: twin-arginine translocation signal domain-containing protein, partial [Anaerolineae bacterium]